MYHAITSDGISHEAYTTRTILRRSKKLVIIIFRCVDVWTKHFCVSVSDFFRAGCVDSVFESRSRRVDKTDRHKKCFDIHTLFRGCPHARAAT